MFGLISLSCHIKLLSPANIAETTINLNVVSSIAIGSFFAIPTIAVGYLYIYVDNKTINSNMYKVKYAIHLNDINATN